MSVLNRRSTARRRMTRVVAVHASPPSTAPAKASCERERRSGGPQDRALYTCHCGYVFNAAVSASVTCPHCGGGQAW